MWFTTLVFVCFFFFKQKTAYEMRISDWSSDVCSSDLARVDDGDKSVLFGLASFAEGVDLPGAYCEHVVIAKIPFAVPDDPVEAALAEWIEARGGNPFMEIAVPDASLDRKRVV